MSSMLNVVQQVVVVFTILVSCASLEPTCFPGCKSTESWSFCFPISKQDYGPNFQRGTCILCPTQLQKQPVLKNSSQPTSTCLPNKRRVAIRGFSFGILSVQKLRPPQQSEINDLSLVQCGITDLEQGILAEFPVLEYLQLDFNNLTHVKQTWFYGLKSPVLFWTLSLSHNNISDMDSKCFQKLTTLDTLLLGSNSLQSIHPSWFHNLKRLGSLSLKSNHIESIPPQAFKSLSRLSHLDLSRNLLTCLSRAAVEGLDGLRTLSLGGNRLLALDDSVHLVMNWWLDYRHFYYTGHRFAVSVNKVLFCITEIPKLREFYHVQMQHDTLTHEARPSVEPLSQCTSLNLGLTSQRKYSLPLIIISVNTESDKHAKNITHLCKHAWENVSLVKVALRGDITLQIVPMGIDRFCNPQIIAIIVLSNIIFNENNTKPYADRHSNNVSAFGHEEMMNVTCLVNTWEETYQHVFTTPLSSTPDGTMCAEKTHATRTVSSTPDDTVCPREGMTLTTREPKIKTTKLTLNQTNPRTNGTVEEKSPRVAIITMVVVVGVVLVALFVTYIIRRQRSCSCISRGPPLGVAALDRWGLPDSHSVTVNNSHVTGVQGTATDTHSSSSSADEHSYEVVDEDDYNYYNTRPGAQHPYWEIPDDHFNYYNTRPEAQHSYGEIPDEHYNYENTRPLSYPLTLRVPEDDEDDAGTFYAAAAEVALPSSTRLGGKHPSYDTVPRVTEYHQGTTKKRLYGTAPRIRTHTRIPACEKKRNIGSYGMPTVGRSKGAALKSCEQNKNVQTHRSKTFSMNVMKMKDKVIDKARSRRQSI
ncbi:uncharacterized protein LOC144887792 [Branchiostoma floridae x Branchiostoma japonicum]